MAVAWTSADYSRSTLNPNAPPFIPSSFQRAAHDLFPSPPRRSEPHRLLKASGSAEDYHWIDHPHHHHGQVPTSSVSAVNGGHGKTNSGSEEEEDIAALLPETFEVEDFSLGLQEEAAPFHTDADQHKRVDALLLQHKTPRYHGCREFDKEGRRKRSHELVCGGAAAPILGGSSCSVSVALSPALLTIYLPQFQHASIRKTMKNKRELPHQMSAFESSEALFLLFSLSLCA